jgi:hypothetical protein
LSRRVRLLFRGILAVEASCLAIACSVDKHLRVWQDCRIANEFAQAALLLLIGSMVGEFVADDGSGVRYYCAYNILLESKREIEVRPCLVAILKYWHAEDKVMQIFNITLALTFVAEANDEAVKLHVCEGHIVRSTGHHLRQVVRRLRFLVLPPRPVILASGSMHTVPLLVLERSQSGEIGARVAVQLLVQRSQAGRRGFSWKVGLA